MPTFDELERSRHDGSRFELYKFETEDNLNEWHYTTDRNPFDFAAKKWTPEAIQRDEVKQVSDGSGQRLTITVPYTNPVAILHVPYLPPTPVRVTVYAVQRRATGVEVKQCFIGYITSFSQKGPDVEFQCSHIIDSQQQRVPWANFGPGCRYTVFQAGCGVLQAPFEDLIVAGNYTIDGDTVSSPIFLARSTSPVDPEWFRAGKLVNPYTGEKRYITSHVGDTIKLIYPFTRVNPLTQSLIAIAGCIRTEAICRTKYNNKLNYLGFDKMPTYNVFDGGVRA